MECYFFQLEIVNRNLEAYYDAWDRFVNTWIIIKIKDPSCVYQWRLEVCIFFLCYFFFNVLNS